jgi:CheY-like chemotaxis protein
MPTRQLRSILYVDDDPDICAIVQATLRHIAGLEVSIVASGILAIEAASKIQPDLILMDVMMPGLDGPSTFKRMRASPTLAHIPVVFLTAKVMPEEVGHFLRLGAIGVIAKPFDPTELCVNLHALWNGRRAGPSLPADSPNDTGVVDMHAASLAAAYIQRAVVDVARLREMLVRARNGDRSAFDEAERTSHSIHGAAGMFGFAEVSALGGTIEGLLQGMRIDNIAEGMTGDAAALEGLWLRAEQLAYEVDAAVHLAPRAFAT